MMKGVGVLSTSSSFPGKIGTYVKLERVGIKSWKRIEIRMNRKNKSKTEQCSL